MPPRSPDPDDRRVAALDGIRGLACLSVFLFHAVGAPGQPLLAKGYLGVQAFFVLSGFLITGRLLALADRADLTAGRRWSAFAVRRVARIFPLYYAVLALRWLDDGRLLTRIPRVAWPWLLTYTANIGKLVTEETMGPPHYWSLCVEEQYYLVFPLLVLTPLRRWLGAITLGLVTGSIVMRAVCPPGCADWLPVMHFNSFGAGVLAALVARGGATNAGATRALHALGLLGGAVFVLLLVAPSIELTEAGLPTALSFATASLVLAMHAGRRNLASLVLGAKPLTALGRISYGLYVVHPSVLYALRASLGRTPYLHAAAGLVASIGVAWISYAFFESPILERARRATRLPRRAERGVQAAAIDAL